MITNKITKKHPSSPFIDLHRPSAQEESSMKASYRLNRRLDGLIRGGKIKKEMKGDEGLIFTLHPQNPCVYRHSRRKDEG